MHSHSAHNHHPHSHELNEDNDSDPIEVEVEQTEEEFQRKVSATFDLYLVRSTASNSKRKADFYNLSKAHRDLLPDYIQLINSVSDWIYSFSYRNENKSDDSSIYRSTRNLGSTIN